MYRYPGTSEWLTDRAIGAKLGTNSLHGVLKKIPDMEYKVKFRKHRYLCFLNLTLYSISGIFFNTPCKLLVPSLEPIALSVNHSFVFGYLYIKASPLPISNP